MFEAPVISADDKAAFHEELAQLLTGLLSGERDPVANAANTAALVYQYLPDLNWAGFYFLREGAELVLGPFQGKPACVRIPVGKGVCGTAVAERRSVLVPDVEAFPGHIACDAGSRSELVVPVFQGAAILGVIDLDSPRLDRFDDADRRGIERIAAIYASSLL